MAIKKEQKHFLVGITGGIGAGKSKVSKILQEKGYNVLSADDFAREITLPGSPALLELAQVFGENSIDSTGALNRSYIRSEILRDSSLKKKLEAITHPRIQSLTLDRSNALFKLGNRIVFYEAPLLFEANSHRNMDYVICVHAKDNLRIKRIIDRDHVSEKEAEKILLLQMPQEEKMKKSNFLIENNGSEAQLKKNIELVLDDILSQLNK